MQTNETTHIVGQKRGGEEFGNQNDVQIGYGVRCTRTESSGTWEKKRREAGGRRRRASRVAVREVRELALARVLRRRVGPAAQQEARHVRDAAHAAALRRVLLQRTCTRAPEWERIDAQSSCAIGNRKSVIWSTDRDRHDMDVAGIARSATRAGLVDMLSRNQFHSPPQNRRAGGHWQVTMPLWLVLRAVRLAARRMPRTSNECWAPTDRAAAAAANERRWDETRRRVRCTCVVKYSIIVYWNCDLRLSSTFSRRGRSPPARYRCPRAPRDAKDRARAHASICASTFTSLVIRRSATVPARPRRAAPRSYTNGSGAWKHFDSARRQTRKSQSNNWYLITRSEMEKRSGSHATAEAPVSIRNCLLYTTTAMCALSVDF